MTSTYKRVSGLGDIFSGYDGFILDLWGVVHDGVKPLPGALEVLTLLKKANRKVWMLSNAPRRVAVVEQKLTDMGIARDLYTGLLTSGEASWLALKEGLLEKWGRRCLHLGRPDDRSIFEELDLEMVTDPAQADFLGVTGLDMKGDAIERYVPILEESQRHNLPFLCANPDRVVHIEEQLIICAGTLADMYEQLGGDVHWFGKPHRAVYSRILKNMPPRVLAVGDSMITDIAGATGAGIDSLLITSGLHRDEFSDSFLEKYPYQPTYVTKDFAW